MPKLLQDLSFPAIMAGFITCMIGISVSAVLVIEAAQSLGANQAQISSWLWALGIGIGVSGFLLSWKYRYPISTAWSTAGLALVIASAGHYSLGRSNWRFSDFWHPDCLSGIFWNFRANFPVYSTNV